QLAPRQEWRPQWHDRVVLRWMRRCGHGHTRADTVGWSSAGLGKTHLQPDAVAEGSDHRIVHLRRQQYRLAARDVDRIAPAVHAELRAALEHHPDDRLIVWDFLMQPLGHADLFDAEERAIDPAR